MPHLQDDRFKQSVILIFEHNSQGATGLVINKEIEKGISSVSYTHLTLPTKA